MAGDLPDKLINWYRSQTTKLAYDMEESVREAGQFGEELMREYIETRGAKAVWERPWDGRTGSTPGRVHTGKMRNAAKHRINKLRASLQLRIGWVSGTREGYFKDQEYGFKHNKTGEKIEGMFALQDATEATFRYLREEMKARIRGKS